MKRGLSLMLLCFLVLWTGALALAQETIQLRFLCFNEGKECEVYDDLLARFSQENPGITVAIDVADAAEIADRLAAAMESVEAYDIARISDFGALAGGYLDLRPHLSDAESFAASFQAPFLRAMRAGAGDGIHGFPDALGVVAPFVNVSLFEGTGLSVPEDGSSWDDWLAALERVAAASGVPYALAVDNKDHRLVGPAMSLGASYFDAEGALTLDDDAGLRDFLLTLNELMAEGRTPADTLLGTGGSQDYFTRGETVMYICGSWKVESVAAEVGEAFDWAIVPNPSGPGGGTGVAQATAVAALAATDHPEAVAKVFEYLIGAEVSAEFAARTLTIPAQLEAAASTIDYDTSSDAIAAALNAFVSEAAKLRDQAIALDLHPLASVYYEASNRNLRAYFAGELTLDEALAELKARLREAR